MYFKKKDIGFENTLGECICTRPQVIFIFTGTQCVKPTCLMNEWMNVKLMLKNL